MRSVYIAVVRVIVTKGSTPGKFRMHIRFPIVPVIQDRRLPLRRARSRILNSLLITKALSIALTYWASSPTRHQLRFLHNNWLWEILQEMLLISWRQLPLLFLQKTLQILSLFLESLSELLFIDYILRKRYTLGH